MNQTFDYKSIFTPKILKELFPEHLADEFFEALLGDSKEGAYDIRLAFAGKETDRLVFELQLHQRKGKCLACNLTYGLPSVFSRHPLINLSGLVSKIDKLLHDKINLKKWSLGHTREISKELHVIPLYIEIAI
jgi:hypothetical protein